MKVLVYDKVTLYINQIEADKHHRYKSWEHCFNFFKKFIMLSEEEQLLNLETACLNLAFYLASWGMMRNSFLLQKDYNVHEYFVREVVMNKVNNEFHGSIVNDNGSISGGLDELIQETRQAYVKNIHIVNGINEDIKISDTLASKILLGVYGCVPAYDKYFIAGMKLHGIKGTSFTLDSMKKLIGFCNVHIEVFNHLKKYLSNLGKDYTLMKLLDMYLWQCGYDAAKDGISIPKAVKSYDIPTKKIKTSNVDDVRKLIRKKIFDAKEQGLEFIDLRSGDLHNELGYSNRMPTVCSAMESITEAKYHVLHDTPSGKSSTKLLRYILRNENYNENK